MQAKVSEKLEQGNWLAVVMTTELEQLRQEAEQLKTQIRVRCICNSICLESVISMVIDIK